jgi:hypothetical protein
MLSGMTESAVGRFSECVLKFAAALAREASRLEEADRAEDVRKPEITMTMVVKANNLIRHPAIEGDSAKAAITIAQITAIAATIVTPIFGANLHSLWQWTATIGCGILALVSQAYAIFAARRK